MNPAAQRWLTVDIGDRIIAADGTDRSVVGVVELPEQLTPMVMLHPTGMPVTAERSDTSYLVDLPGQFTDDLFRQFNQRGVVVTARVPAPDSSAVPSPPGPSRGVWRR